MTTAARRRRRLASDRVVALAGAAVILVVTLALLGLAWYERAEHLDRVGERNVLFARVLADHATRSVDGAALAASTIDELLSRGIAPEGPEMRAALAQTLVSLPFLRGVGVVDAQGVIVGSADGAELNLVLDLTRLGPLPERGQNLLGPYVEGRRLADLAAGGSARIATGVGFLPLLRGAALPGNQRVMVVALINVDALTTFQQTTLADAHAAAALLSYDGRFVGASGGVTRRVGESLADLPPFTQYLPDREHGAWRGAGLRSGEQLATFRVTRTWPLVVLVEYAAEAALTEWRHGVQRLLAASAAALLFVAAMTVLAVRSLRARDRAQQAVVQREQELAITLQSLQELVFRCDADGRLTFVNAEWTRATGCTEAASMGRKLAEWVGPTERVAAAALFQRDAGAHVRRGHLGLSDAQGEQRSYEFSVTPLLEAAAVVGFAGSAVDVTDRVRAQQRLEAQLSFSELLLESSPLPMSVSSHGRYRMVNQAWESFTGRSRRDAIGDALGAHLAPDERRTHEAHDREAYTTRAPVRYTARVGHADGSQRDVVIEKRTLPGDDGEPAGILTVLIDVTEFREAERATREARDVAEEASRAKSEFIANISHELRTPLQSIIGFSELGLRRAGEQARLAAMFDDIHASGQRMLSLVNDLLDVSRLESTIGTIHLERTDLRGLVREVLHELDLLAAQRQVTLVAQISEQPMRAKVDPLRFQQVVRNVVANAIKFSPPGASVEIESGATPQGRWSVTVADRGPGIPAAELERVFEAFVQSSVTKDGSGGTGLGLAICRKIMQVHDGSIVARRREGGGSVFEIELPGGNTETQPAVL